MFAQVSREAGRPIFQAGHAGSIPVIRSQPLSEVVWPGLKADHLNQFPNVQEVVGVILASGSPFGVSV